MDKYEYCSSCAFQDEPGFICDSCDEGDQWEEAYLEQAAVGYAGTLKPITIHRKKKQ